MGCVRQARRREWMGLAAGLVSTLALEARGLAQAPANPERIAAAQALYDAAVEQLSRGDVAAACPKLEEVTAIEPAGLGARMTLALCYERGGRLASAWVTYKLVEAEAARQGQSGRRERAAAAAQSLAPRLGRLTIDVPDGARAVAGLSVSRDGAKVGAAQWGEALPVDAGAHVVEATAPGGAKWSGTVRVEDGATATLRVEMPAPSPAVAPSAERVAAPSVAPSALPVGGTAVGAGFWDTPRVVGVAAGAFGALALASGAASFGVAADKKSASDPHCARDVCEPAWFGTRTEAVTAGHFATAFAVIGAVGLAGSALLLFAWPRVVKVPVSPLKMAVSPAGARLEVQF